MQELEGHWLKSFMICAVNNFKELNKCSYLAERMNRETQE